MSAEWIDTDEGLARVVDSVRSDERYALDTEFHRERTYYPRLALVQIRWSGGTALIDPLACDARGLGPLFESDSLAVLHAAQQDLDVMQTAIGVVPKRLYDTQLAAGFTGYSTPSLVSLVQGELGITVPKGDRLTDWLRRPLTDSQRDYAASDVAHLLELQDRLDAELAEMGRSTWVLDACEELRCRPTGVGDPADAWLRLKDVRTLRPRGRAIAQAVAEWRERRAMASDIPTRQVLADLAVLGIAQKAPRTTAELGQSRGIDERHIRGGFAQEILDAVSRGLEQTVNLPASDGDELDRTLRPAVTLVSAWMSDLARKQRIDTTLVATRNDIVALLRGDESARLASGWRAELIGDDVKRLVAGRAGLTFDGAGGLRLIAVADTESTVDAVDASVTSDTDGSPTP
jgi:ribonuclease D